MIICAESDPLALRMLERQIAMLGQPFLSATTGQQVLTYAHYPGIQLILLSVELADQAGIAVLQQLKAAPTTRPLPVVMIASTVEYEGAALAAGCLAYWVKPFAAVQLGRIWRTITVST
jgi:CheY-like chemotaxis protein